MIFHITVRRYKWLPRFVNDWREGRIVKAQVCSRLKDGYTDAWYRVLPGRSLAGERPRSLFITKGDGTVTVYKMTAMRWSGGMEIMTFAGEEYEERT